MKSQTEIDAMNAFAQKMNDLYNDAEGLRDCTEISEEKELFNQTRGALYDLRRKASKIADKWESQNN